MRLFSQLHVDFGPVGHAMSALMEAVDVDQGAGRASGL
jgi:hypothetical protein